MVVERESGARRYLQAGRSALKRDAPKEDSKLTSSSNSTKAKPFARPLSSVGTRTSLMVPYGSKSLRRSASLTDLARFAMYSSRLLALASVRLFLRDGSETKTERG